MIPITSPNIPSTSQGDMEKHCNPSLNTPTIRDESSDQNNPTTSDPKEPLQERTIRGFRWFLVCVAIFSANFLYGLDTTIAEKLKKLDWLGIALNTGTYVCFAMAPSPLAVLSGRGMMVGLSPVSADCFIAVSYKEANKRWVTEPVGGG